MARHPDWFERLDTIEETLRSATLTPILGRREVRAVFGVSERDSIRLLHKFGAQHQADALAVGRSALLAQLGAVRAGSAYQAFLRHREHVAGRRTGAGGIRSAPFSRPLAREEPERARLDNLPSTLSWRRASPQPPGRLEILYDDGADLMCQLAEFLAAAGVNR